MCESGETVKNHAYFSALTFDPLTFLGGCNNRKQLGVCGFIFRYNSFNLTSIQREILFFSRNLSFRLKLNNCVFFILTNLVEYPLTPNHGIQSRSSDKKTLFPSWDYSQTNIYISKKSFLVNV